MSKFMAGKEKNFYFFQQLLKPLILLAYNIHIGEKSYQ